MTPQHSHPGAIVPPARRRDGRAGPRALTAAFRRFVEVVQAHEDPSPADDLDAAFTLAAEIMGHRRSRDIDAALVEAYGPSIRALATAVRRAGRGAVSHPALLARAVVLARTLERTAAGRRAGRSRRDAFLAAR